jgi:outer membrane receptor protein involved in Fe transport
MKPPLHTPANRASQALAFGLAALLTVSPAFGQSADSDALRRLQEENAALRKRLAEMEAPAAKPAAPTAQTEPAASAPRSSMAAEPSDPETLILSPFEVKSEKDYGYLKTNSATATRIGTDIQKVPLNISIISEDFINDTNMKDIQDVLRYQSSSAGDGRMGIIQPATSFTPAGGITLRGFPINSRLRNGLLRYNAFNLDNVDRIEVIKGPAALFFGGAYPGGVINYVTKQPSFSKIPTSVSYSYGGFDSRIGGQQVKLDNNTVLSDKAAMRIVGAWTNGIGDQRYEYEQGYSVNAGLTLVPLKSGRLKIAIEGEVLNRTKNQNDTSYIWPTQWLDDYKAPPAALLTLTGLTASAYQARIFNNVGQWIADKRNAANDQYLPLYTSVARGGYITDMAGNRVLDEKFNYYGSGTYTKDDNSTFSVTTDFAAASWLDVRHSYTNVQHRFDRIFSAANPYADGMRYNQASGIGYQGYEIDAYYHQLDLVLKQKFAGVDNKVLLGGLMGETYSSFYGNVAHANLNPMYGYLPGAYDKPDEGYVSPIPAAFRHPITGWGVAQQYIRDRTGKILTPQEIFSLYDPGFHLNPDIRRIMEVTRGLVDHSRPKREEWYVNWQGTALEDRLTMFAGYREEKSTSVGQLVAANPPWWSAPDYALQNIPQSEWLTYGLSSIFSQPRVTKGKSSMVGFSYEVKKNINVYASLSHTYLPPGPSTLGGDYDPNGVIARATLIGLNPTTELARLASGGGLVTPVNETGKNLEFGVKVSLDDNKLVGTFSLFQSERVDRLAEDIPRQFAEPLNYALPNNAGGFSRTVRWYTDTAHERTRGAEFEAIWTPVRNLQAVISGSWMWEAKLLSDKSIELPPVPTTAQIIQREISYGSRLVNAPEYRFNIWTKYTFDQNFIGEHGRGFSVGLGARYASEINIQNNVNMWTARGGLAAGDYVVFDTTLSYPFEVLGYKMTGSLNVTNLTDKDYLEGNYNLADPRAYRFTLGMKF